MVAYSLGWSYGNAFVGEFRMALLIVFTVLVSAVFSVSPTRSFRPAVAAWITGEGHLSVHVGLLSWTIGWVVNNLFEV